MTPSNPSNSQPLIYRIMDALGVSHLVACINHTHEQSEVDGLVSDLAGKIAKLTSFTTGNFVKVKADGTLEDSGKSASDFQTPLTFDSTPTANSTNPVTSGGVKAALNDKLSITTYDDNNWNSVSIEPYFENSLNFGFAITLCEHDGTEYEAKISANNIQNLSDMLGDYDSVLRIMATKVSNATANNFAALDGSGNIKDSGKKASDFADRVHTHASLDTGYALIEVYEDGKVKIYGGSINIDITGEDDVTINSSNVGNLARALQTPDSTPTANSDNLVTSGGVAAAIAGLGSPSVVPHIFVNITDKINVTQLDNDTVYSVEISGQQTIPGCFTGGTINWIGTKQTDSCDQFLFRYYKVTYGQFGATYHYVEVIETKNSWE